ncbi:MAG TPA: wax ester/triacylglycerol synthase family O-acyltransferase [Candidatus Dormibacteraeota bacterium]
MTFNDAYTNLAAFFEPLGARDAWFLYAERPDTPLDIGTVYVFEPGSDFPGGHGAVGIEDTIAERLHLVPRYRQKIKFVPFNLDHPVWVDDANFDLGQHVRRVLLKPPGDAAQMRAEVMRILSRPLDHRRPLWEVTIIQGLRSGKVVVVNRAHHAMLDGVASVDILALLLDASPETYHAEPPAEPWVARPAPTGWELFRRVLWNPRAEHGEGVDLSDAWRAWRQPWIGWWQIGRSMAVPDKELFWNRSIGPKRTGRGLKLPLAAFKTLKNRYGCTVNDAVLAVIAEGLHQWFRSRGDWVPEEIRVFCPVSVRDPSERGRLGNRISGMVVEMPTAAMSIEERLSRIRVRTGDLKRSGQAIAADKLAGLADWAPASLLVLAGRVMSTPQAGAKLNVTNIPGPQVPLYSGGAQLLEVWPFAPLYPSMGLGIAIVSYNGEVFFGLTADPGLVPDVEEFTRHLREAADRCLSLAAAE